MKGIRLIGLILAGTLAASLAQAQTTSAYCASGKPIRLAGITWESGQFTTEVVRYILEKGYGCKTEVVPGSTNATEAGLISGDLQIWGEQWEGVSNAINAGIKDGKVRLVGNILDGGTVEGWFVPDYVVKGDPKRGIKPMAPDLKSVSDLPKYKALFKDDEQPNMGRFYNCPVGWVCEKTNGQKLIAYGLSKDFTNFKPGNGAGLDAAIAGAYEKGQPIVFYYWAPTGFMSRFNFIRLEEPKYNEACYKSETDPANKAPCGSATPSTNLRFGVSNMLPATDAINGLLGKVQFPLDFFNKVIAEISIEKKAPTQVAMDFLKERPAVWSKWVPADVATKVQASLK
ncbi:MAG: ABC transporter substrate-binding protein [Thermaceae bacterium]|nr:ABC transporter substrate-binding protein [Thermaceae bacterium]